MRKYCCDPLRRHKKQITKSLKPISETLVSKCSKLRLGQLICSNCWAMLSKLPELLNEIEGPHEIDSLDYVSGSSSERSSTPPEQATEDIPQILTALKVTPLKKRKY